MKKKQWIITIIIILIWLWAFTYRFLSTRLLPWCPEWYHEDTFNSKSICTIDYMSYWSNRNIIWCKTIEWYEREICEYHTEKRQWATSRITKNWSITKDPWFQYSEKIIRCPNWYVYNRIEYKTWNVITDEIPKKIKWILKTIENDKWTDAYCTWAYIISYNHFEYSEEVWWARCTFDFEADNINCP